MPEIKGRIKVHITPLLGDVYLIPEAAHGPGEDIVIVHSAETARRMTACWNACLGMSTSSLEAMVASGKLVAARAKSDAELANDAQRAAILESAR